MKEARLKKVATHLERGKLGHKRFDFLIVNSTKEAKCGTSGCALGEFPILWPKHWTWKIGGGVGLVAEEMESDSFQAASQWLDITTIESMALFHPYYQGQFEAVAGLKMLGKNATRKEVAANIRKFIAWKKEKSK